MTTDLRPAPPWVRAAGAVIRRLPAGRYRLAGCVARRAGRPFVATAGREVGGFLFACDLRDSTSREVCLTGRYEPQETAVVLAILSPGGTFVDVGANWGYFTLTAAHLVGPAGRVVGFEPDPRLFATLAANVARNGYSHVTVVQAAVAEKTGTVTLNGFDPAGGNFGVSTMAGGTGGQPFEVATVGLDAALDAAGVGTVDLVKIDIEGAEGLALTGMQAGIRSGRYRRLLIELHPTLLPRFGATAEGVVAVALSAGYQCWEVAHDPASTRRTAYARRVDPRALLTPWDAGRPLAAWPHVLLARGHPLPVGSPS